MPKTKTNTKKKNAGKPKKKDVGQKVSKSLGSFAPIRELMNSSLGREVLADVLIAAAGAAAAALTRSRGANAKAARDSVNTAAGAVASVVTDAARNFLPASLLGDDEEPAKPALAKGAKRGADRKPKTAGTSAAPKKRKVPSRKPADVREATAPKIAET